MKLSDRIIDKIIHKVVAYTPKDFHNCEEHKEHYKGCKCHEANWQRQVDAERDAHVSRCEEMAEHELTKSQLKEIKAERDEARHAILLMIISGGISIMLVIMLLVDLVSCEWK